MPKGSQAIIQCAEKEDTRLVKTTDKLICLNVIELNKAGLSGGFQ